MASAMAFPILARVESLLEEELLLDEESSLSP